MLGYQQSVLNPRYFVKKNAMRKVLLTILIGCMGIFPSHASTTISMDEKATTNQEVNIGEMLTFIPFFPMYHLTYNSDLSMLTFHRRIVKDSLFVVLQNITTGESQFNSFGSSCEVSFPITGEEGLWRISVGRAPSSHNPAILYEYYFTIENDKIITYESVE